MNFETDLNDFEFLDLLGSGSFGKVNLVKDLKTNELFAIKQFDKNLLKESELNKIYSEAQLLSSLDHPNIIKFYKLYSTYNKLYILMEYAEHGTLYNYFKQIRKSCLEISEVKIIMVSLLQSIAYLHNQNIIHRDIKQENILISDLNDLSKIKLADFGLSSQFEIDKFATFNSQCGTLIYMSPEFFKNYINCTKAVDVYSCGILLYELIHQGRHPFIQGKVNNLEQIKKYIVEGKFNNGFQCSYEMESLIRRMTAKEQSERLSVEQALGALTNNQIPLTICDMMNGMDKLTKIQGLFQVIRFVLWLCHQSNHQYHKQISQKFIYEPKLSGLQQKYLIELREKIKENSTNNKNKTALNLSRKLKISKLKLKLNSSVKLDKTKLSAKFDNQDDERSSLNSCESREFLSGPKNTYTLKGGKKSIFFNQKCNSFTNQFSGRISENQEQDEFKNNDQIMLNSQINKKKQSKFQIQQTNSQNASILSSQSSKKQPIPKEVENILKKNLIAKKKAWNNQKKFAKSSLQLEMFDTSLNQLYYSKQNNIKTPSKFMPQQQNLSLKEIQQKYSESTRNRQSSFALPKITTPQNKAQLSSTLNSKGEKKFFPMITTKKNFLDEDINSQNQQILKFF